MWGPPPDIAEYFGGYKCQEVGQVPSCFVNCVEFMENSKLDMNLNLQLSTDPPNALSQEDGSTALPDDNAVCANFN